MTATTSVLVSEWADPDENDGNWPFPTEYKKFLIGGDLAERVRARLGVEGDEPVYITEEAVSGGWSEFTTETDFFFRVECAGRRADFDQYKPHVHYDATTVARLQAWIGEPS